jgi:putative transcriptional regulator
MTIKLRLAELLKESGHTRYWLFKETKIRYATLLKMLEGKSKRLELAAIEKICIALQCQPGDLFALTPKPKRKG